MSGQPEFDPSFAEALQSNMAVKTDSYNSGTANRQNANPDEKLQAAENETKALRNGIEAIVSDLLEARNEAKKAYDAKEQLELRCTELSQEVESLRTALESERRHQAALHESQTSATALEQQSPQQLVNTGTTSEEMQLDDFQGATELQAADIGKLQELVRFYKGNSERLSAEIQQLKAESRQQ
ncbi:hypothetical protein GQX73_g613 [Xylaria multiplex]|uniref:Uncharacterized protein n=1 Tax=Xylaria multiplex TaxID=323545 RepID=A0A7C8N128_9PEZI|nr:hypothetical protein GQX73_g613 [Xylaria multiplex]